MLYFACNVQKQETHSVGEHDAHQDGEKKRDAHHDGGFFWFAVIVRGAWGEYEVKETSRRGMTVDRIGEVRNSKALHQFAGSFRAHKQLPNI